MRTDFHADVFVASLTNMIRNNQDLLNHAPDDRLKELLKVVIGAVEAKANSTKPNPQDFIHAITDLMVLLGNQRERLKREREPFLF